MRVSSFDFDLPPDLIAQEPGPRGAARLMRLARTTGEVSHFTVRDLPALLSPGDLLVVNDTRVFAARLLGSRVPSGGAAECLLLGPADADGDDAREDVYDALVHPGQKLRPGALMRFEGAAGVLMGEILARRFHGRRRVRLWSESGAPVEQVVDALGHVPLPPYIKRADHAGDRERYQTVYARARGSVAAPTAGLHFTPELLARLAERGIERAAITLHVGYGTFKPVRVVDVEQHVVDPERYDVPEATASAIERARADGRRIVAVGTTTTRALEDAALRGNGSIPIGPAMASLFIYPGFEFKVISGLMTNFHLPKSSLLMLASAFAGQDAVLAAYRDAVAMRYRFYSYGDAMVIL